MLPNTVALSSISSNSSADVRQGRYIAPRLLPVDFSTIMVYRPK
jgi:hypothetical protein